MYGEVGEEEEEEVGEIFKEKCMVGVGEEEEEEEEESSASSLIEAH